MLRLEVVVRGDNTASKIKGHFAEREIHRGAPEAAKIHVYPDVGYPPQILPSCVLPFMFHTGSDILKDIFQVTASKPGKFSQNGRASLGNILALPGSFYVVTSFFLFVRKHRWDFTLQK